MPSNDYKDPVGFPFLPVPKNGQLAFPALERSVRDSIRIILSTRPGEQLMRPRFGAGLQNFLDGSNTVAMRREIQSAIMSSLQSYEPRIAVDRVDVDPNPNASSEIHVQIHYRLVRTNAAQQFGVTMQAE
jgi:phage baseplate assembly protein W